MRVRMCRSQYSRRSVYPQKTCAIFYSIKLVDINNISGYRHFNYIVPDKLGHIHHAGIFMNFQNEGYECVETSFFRPSVSEARWQMTTGWKARRRGRKTLTIQLSCSCPSGLRRPLKLGPVLSQRTVISQSLCPYWIPNAPTATMSRAGHEVSDSDQEM